MFFGLKDKYMYYTVGVIILGFIIIAILNSTIGFVGTMIGAGIMAIAIWSIFYLQDKKGLYKKTKNKNELHIFPKQIKNRTILEYHNEKKQSF